jgi:hypothetical protein
MENNIQFFLEETNCNNGDNNEIIHNLMNEFSNLTSKTPTPIPIPIPNMNSWFNDTCREIDYTDYTIKNLLKICNYYGLDKSIKASKCKKQDIIDTLIYFESLPENAVIVHNRITMWEYMSAIMNDPKMKQYVLF